MNPELSIVRIEGGYYPEGCLEVVDSLLHLTLGGAYLAKNTVAFAGYESIDSFWEEVDRLQCGYFCGVELVVFT